MPHIIVEYSPNITDQVDVKGLCTDLLDTALETDIFEVGAVRVRAYAASAYAITDKHADNSFVDISVRMAAGRSQEIKRDLGDRLFAIACKGLEPLYQTPHFALSIEIREIDPSLSWRKNGMHDRLRGQTT